MKPHFLLFSQARDIPASTVLAGAPSSPPPACEGELPEPAVEDHAHPLRASRPRAEGTGEPEAEVANPGVAEAGPLKIPQADSAGVVRGGWWHFLLESMDGSQRLEAEDYEAQWGGERLELLAVVRGLEALDQPSRVILVTPSRYVHRGLRFGLSPWRDNHWLWERFGELAPVKNADLWQRVDRALEFHRLECRLWRLDNEPAGDERSVVPRPHFRRRPAVPRESAASGIGGWLATARETVEQWTAAASHPGGRRCVAAGH